MIVVCPKCSSRLQTGGNKPLVHPFTVRCPKCKSLVNSEPQNPAATQSALAVGDSPATEHKRYKDNDPAPLFEAESVGQSAHQTSIEELGRLLGSMLGQAVPDARMKNGARPTWNPRKILICAAAQHRQNLARVLTENGYQVFVAQEMRQAIERMRENSLDVVLLDQDFDSADQGAAFVTREVTMLRPQQRRRLFFCLLSPALRTMETHAAFLNNVNAIINIKDLDDTPRVLEHALREYNELYKEFNVALNVTAL